MRWTILILSFLLLTFCMWAQGPSADKTETNAIQRVKALPIPSLDRSLPRVTLEFFLAYEGQGAPIKWEATDCSEPNRDKVVVHGPDSAMCVEADIALKNGRTVTVLISVGTFKRGAVDVPAVYSVKVAYPAGRIHQLDRLRDLPVELHRPPPKGPRDLPDPVGSVLSALADADSHAS